jgi:hypothetical protein
MNELVGEHPRKASQYVLAIECDVATRPSVLSTVISPEFVVTSCGPKDHNKCEEHLPFIASYSTRGDTGEFVCVFRKCFWP